MRSMCRRMLVLILLTATAVAFAVALPGLVTAFSQSDTAYYDGFADLTGVDAAASDHIMLDALGGVRLVTDGPSNPAVWTSTADFTNPTTPLGPLVDLPTLDGATQAGTLRLASSPLAFRRAQAGPVLTPPAALSVDGYGVGGMCVVRTDTEYVMWYTGVPENGFVKTISRATSPDGATWTKDATPVLSLGDAGAFDSRQLGKPWVIYDPANTAAPYRMWYSAEGDYGGSIGYATSADGIAWTKTGEVLPPGPRNAPDSYSAAQPSVVIDNGVYRMWYTASDSNNRRVAFATSTDGLVWQRGGVVFDVAGGNYGQGAWAPTVWKDTGGGFHMLFTGNKIVAGGQIQAKLINASSSDGVTWTAGSIAVNPGNQTAGDFDGFNLSQPDVLPDPADATNPYKLWYVGNNPDANGNYHDRIGYAVSANGSKWTKVPGPAGAPSWNAVLTLGTQSTAFDSMKVADLRPAVGPTAGTLYGFYTGTNAADFVQRIGLVLSTDGAPLIDKGGVGAFDEGGVATPAAVYDAGGSTWVIYHTALSGGGATVVALHTATADLVTVTRSASPVLPAGSGFDAGGCADPAVIDQAGSLTVFYAGKDSAGVWSLGRATGSLSAPQTLTKTGQVLAPSAGTYDAGGLRKPVVLLDAGTWHLWYTAIDALGVQRLAYATSPDGVTWTKQGLALTPSPTAYDIAEQGIEPAGAWKDGSLTKLTFTGIDRFGWSRIGLATATGAGYIDAGSAGYELDNATPQDWRKIIWNPTSVPAGTTMQVCVSYYPTYSNLWSSWFPITSGSDLPLLLSVQNVRWQVRMTSDSPAATPRLDDMTINHADIHFPATGKLVTMPIGPPTGKYLLTWGDLTVNADVPGGAGLWVTVKDEGGATLLATQPVGGTPISLAAVPATSGRLVVVFDLTSNGAVTPKIKSLNVTYTTTATPSGLTLQSSKASLTYGGSATLSGALMSDTLPLGSQTVTIEQRTLAQTSFSALGTATTAADGSFSVAGVKPTASTIYKASWPGGDVGGTVYPPAVATVRVDVKPKVTETVSNYVSRSGSYYRYPLGRKVVVKGKVTPNHAKLADGTTAGTVTVKVYKRKYSSTLKKYVWSSVKSAKRTLTSTSAYSWSWTPSARGTYRLRATFPGDVDHLTATSVFRYVKVY